MRDLSTTVCRLLTASILTFAPVIVGAADWPVKHEIDLSSGFGNYRQTHFHFGLDIRTGGRIGREIFSPVDGYVWRVRAAYRGYGKALYIKGTDQNYYVYGHLANFDGTVDQLVKTTQLATRRYALDIELPPDSIRVHSGQFIGYTGQTGAGAPHLQFEVRSPDNVPLNPLRLGYELDDRVPPVFSRVGCHLTDDRSLLPNGLRKLLLPVARTGAGQDYTLDTLLYLHRPFGFLVECFDHMRTGGMKQAVYRLSLFIDDDLYYEVVFDSLDFATTAAVNLEYDYVEATDDRNHVRTLFKKPGNDFPGSRALTTERGVFGSRGDETCGLHRVRIVAEDCFGNRSELHFSFLWGPPDNLFTLDSTITPAPDSTYFYFSSVVDPDTMHIDSVKVLTNRGALWGQSSTVETILEDDGQVLCKVKAKGIHAVVLRLFAFAGDDCLIMDTLFNGFLDRSKGAIEVNRRVLEDGLLVEIHGTSPSATSPRVDLYHAGKHLGTEKPLCYNTSLYLCFIPPREQYARIDRLVVTMSQDPNAAPARADSVNIVCVGFNESDTVSIGRHLTLDLGQQNFYKPQYLELEENPVINRYRLGLNSPSYRIEPEAFVCRKPFEMRLKLPYQHKMNHQSGLCWLDRKKDRWVWLTDSEFREDTVRATSLGGGVFAALIDTEAPRFKYLTISDGRTYQNRQPAVNFVIEESLSGIEDDRSVVVEIDGDWLIPEYDPETGQVLCKPVDPLEPGKHHLGIRVTDRAGNLGEQYLNFLVKGQKGGSRN